MPYLHSACPFVSTRRVLHPRSQQHQQAALRRASLGTCSLLVQACHWREDRELLLTSVLPLLNAPKQGTGLLELVLKQSIECKVMTRAVRNSISPAHVSCVRFRVSRSLIRSEIGSNMHTTCHPYAVLRCQQIFLYEMVLKPLVT